MTGDLYTNLLREETLEAEDICRLQTLYPATAKQIREQVEQECDRMNMRAAGCLTRCRML